MDKGDDGGPFGRRYLIVSALRVTGHVDLAVLQGALDDVVARHELLRTLVIRDADPPCQQVFPPCPVPLQVRDLPLHPPHPSRTPRITRNAGLTLVALKHALASPGPLAGPCQYPGSDDPRVRGSAADCGAHRRR